MNTYDFKYCEDDFVYKTLAKNKTTSVNHDVKTNLYLDLLLSK